MHMYIQHIIYILTFMEILAPAQHAGTREDWQLLLSYTFITGNHST